jgi:hypothetical protein
MRTRRTLIFAGIVVLIGFLLFFVPAVKTSETSSHTIESSITTSGYGSVTYWAFGVGGFLTVTTIAYTLYTISPYLTNYTYSIGGL